MMSGVSGEALRGLHCAQNLNVHLIGRATKTKIALDQDYIDERLPIAGKRRSTVR